jgi:hypothetical protein
MLYYWLALTFLAPVTGCMLFVFLAENPSPLTAAAGAIVGMVVSLAAVFALN